MRLPRFLLVFVFLFSIFLSLAATPILGQDQVSDLINIEDPSEKDLKDFCNSRSGNVVNLETWYSGKCKTDDDIGTSDYSGSYRGFADIVILDLAERLGANSNSKLFEAADGSTTGTGLLPGIGALQAMILSRPAASSLDYLAYVDNNIHRPKLVTPAYAATTTGLGFISLSPVLGFWRGMRNLTYMVFVLVFVVYGFMIMFRVKINPQTAVSIELALPKIVGTLILITFSYAIAGLLIDLSYLLSAVIVNALQTTGAINLHLFPDKVNILGKVFDVNGFLVSNGLVTDNAPIDAINGRYLGIFGIGLFSALRIIIGSSFSNIVSLITGLPAWAIAIATTVTRVAIVIKIILIVSMGYAMFKLLFELIKTYATVILLIIFSPIILIGNILPADRDGSAFEKWLRNLFANLAVFPTVMVVYMIAATLVGPNAFQTPTSNGTSPDMWVPPVFLGGDIANDGIFGGGGVFSANSAKGAAALLGFALLLIAPALADMVREALKVPKFMYGKVIGENLQFGYDVNAKWAANSYNGMPVGNQTSQGMTNITKFGQKFLPTKGPDGKPINFP